MASNDYTEPRIDLSPTAWAADRWGVAQRVDELRESAPDHPALHQLASSIPDHCARWQWCMVAQNVIQLFASSGQLDEARKLYDGILWCLESQPNNWILIENLTAADCSFIAAYLQSGNSTAASAHYDNITHYRSQSPDHSGIAYAQALAAQTFAQYFRNNDDQPSAEAHMETVRVIAEQYTENERVQEVWGEMRKKLQE